MFSALELAVIEALSSGQIQLPVEATYGPDEIKKAVEHADAPGRRGKILVKPWSDQSG